MDCRFLSNPDLALQPGFAAGPAAVLGDEPAGPASFVNPFIGTAGGGGTFPGARSPLWSQRMSPNWKDNGYYFNNTHMHGFVVNLMSGDGGANEGEVLMTATTGTGDDRPRLHRLPVRPSP